MTRYEMLSRMPAPELSDWIAYASVEPIGERRMDLRFAVLACTITNLIKGACGDKTPPVKVKYFLDILGFDAPVQQSEEKMKSILRSLSGK